MAVSGHCTGWQVWWGTDLGTGVRRRNPIHLYMNLFQNSVSVDLWSIEKPSWEPVFLLNPRLFFQTEVLQKPHIKKVIADNRKWIFLIFCTFLIQNATLIRTGITCETRLVWWVKPYWFDRQIQAVLTAKTNSKPKLLLMPVYSAGLRVNEAVLLKKVHIDFARKLIRVATGKERYSFVPKNDISM